MEGEGFETSRLPLSLPLPPPNPNAINTVLPISQAAAALAPALPRNTAAMYAPPPRLVRTGDECVSREMGRSRLRIRSTGAGSSWRRFRGWWRRLPTSACLRGTPTILSTTKTTTIRVRISNLTRTCRLKGQGKSHPFPRLRAVGDSDDPPSAPHATLGLDTCRKLLKDHS